MRVTLEIGETRLNHVRQLKMTHLIPHSPAMRMKNTSRLLAPETWEFWKRDTSTTKSLALSCMSLPEKWFSTAHFARQKMPRMENTSANVGTFSGNIFRI